MSAEKPSIVCRSAKRCNNARKRRSQCAMTVDPSPPAAVLDTNVVLDWLVFRNSDCATLTDAISAGKLQWIATPPMRDELVHVLAGHHLDAWALDSASVWAQWDRHCMELPTPAPTGPRGRLRCSDRDDQMFIDLAVAAGARWLLTRDRAVLKLARYLRLHGIDAVPPKRWTLTTS